MSIRISLRSLYKQQHEMNYTLPTINYLSCFTLIVRVIGKNKA